MLSFFLVVGKPCTYIFCHTQMAHRIHAVWRKANLKNIIVVGLK